jgi:predicted secreted protein
MSLPLGVAIYIILWWLTFFTVLPLGAQSYHEADEQHVPGTDRGAPRVHDLRKKALIAAGIAALLWIGVYWAITNDVFHLFSDQPG